MTLFLLALAAMLAAGALGAAGVYLLFGLGWTLLFLAGCSAGLSIVLLRGLTNG